MKIQKQTDGTWLAEEHINDRLAIAEGRNQSEAWYSLIDMLSAHFHAQADEMIGGHQ